MQNALPRYLCLFSFLALWLGMGHLYFPLWASLLCLSILLIILIILRQRSFWAYPIVLLCFALLGPITMGLSPTASVQKVWSGLVKSSVNKPQRISGVVSGRLSLKSTKSGWQQFDIDKVVIHRDKESFSIPGKLLIRSSAEKVSLSYGDEVEVNALLTKPTGLRNPNGFDYQKYLERNQIFAIATTKSIKKLGLASGWDGLWLSYKSHFIHVLKTYLPENTYLTAAALFLGERKGLDYEFRQALAQTGTLHLFAISGLHVGIVAGFVLWLMRCLGFKRMWAHTFTGLFVLHYALLSGASSSSMRAAIMTCAILWAMSIRRRPAALNALGVAGIGLLCFNPSEIHNPGFTLSFVATMGLIAIVPLFYSVDDIRNLRSGIWYKKFEAYAMSCVVISICAWFITLPWSAYYFHNFNWVSPILNIFLIPVVTVLVALLLCFICLASFLPLAGNMLSPQITHLVDALIQSVMVVDQWDVLQWATKSFSIWVWLIYGFGIIWLIISPTRGRVMRLVVILLIISNGLLLNSVLAHTKPSQLKVTFFDIGQGDCTLIEFASGGRLLVDTGKAGFGGGLSVIAPYLRAQGLDRIDAIVITHPQFDHAGDISALVEQMNIGAVITNGDDVSTDFFRRAKESVAKKHIPFLTLDSDHTIRGFKDVLIEVLHPSSSSHGVLDLNNRSIVLRVLTPQGSVLLTGDIEKDAMRRINLSGQSIQASLVKVPHHGAAINQDGKEFLNQSKADIWVIPVGEDNRYGHPKKVTWDYLKQTQKPVYRNDYHGAIQFTKRSLNKPWEVVTFAN